jgi:hypothetical protein
MIQSIFGNGIIWNFEHFDIFIDGFVVFLLIVRRAYDTNKIEITSCHGYSNFFFSFFEGFIT